MIQSLRNGKKSQICDGIQFLKYYRFSVELIFQMKKINVLAESHKMFDRTLDLMDEKQFGQTNSSTEKCLLNFFRRPKKKLETFFPNIVSLHELETFLRFSKTSFQFFIYMNEGSTYWINILQSYRRRKALFF